jgi:hypothetical protein
MLLLAASVYAKPDGLLRNSANSVWAIQASGNTGLRYDRKEIHPVATEAYCPLTTRSSQLRGSMNCSNGATAKWIVIIGSGPATGQEAID